MAKIFYRTNGGGIIAVLERSLTDWDLITVGIIEAPDLVDGEPLDAVTIDDADIGSFGVGLLERPIIDINEWRVCVPNGMLVPLFMDLVIYDPATRLVKYTVNHPVLDGMITGAISAGEQFTWAKMEGVSILDSYVDLDGLIAPRVTLPGEISKTMIAADGIDAAVISGLPIGSNIFVDGSPCGETDGASFDLSVTDAGVYEIRASKMPYLDSRWTVSAS